MSTRSKAEENSIFRPWRGSGFGEYLGCRFGSRVEIKVVVLPFFRFQASIDPFESSFVLEGCGEKPRLGPKLGPSFVLNGLMQSGFSQGLGVSGPHYLVSGNGIRLP
jgi:hypothetical protein